MALKLGSTGVTLKLGSQSVTGRLGSTLVTADTDPYFANVSLLMHMDGSNGSTTFTDSSSSARTLTATGGASISTTQSKFGGASGYFDGDGDGVTMADSDDFAFGSGNFTIEAWVYPLNGTPANTIFSQRAFGTETQLAIALYVSSGSTYLVVSSDGGEWEIDAGGSVSVPDNQWSHIAMVRNGSQWRVYVNGQVSQTTTSEISVYNSTADGGVAQSTAGQYFYGYIDELRVTKGVARYTAAFTPPTAAFPNA